MKNFVAGSLTEEDQQAIRNSLMEVDSKMPFLTSFSPKQRRQIVKMGDKSVDFVQDALVIAKEYPQILPANFSLTEFDNDANLLTALIPIQVVVNELNKKINDTVMGLGSDCMTAAIEVYTYVVAALKSNPELKPAYDRLFSRFGPRKRSDN